MDFEALLTQLRQDLDEVETQREALDKREGALRTAIQAFTALKDTENGMSPVAARAKAVEQCARCSRPKHRGTCRVAAVIDAPPVPPAPTCKKCGGPRSPGSASMCNACYRGAPKAGAAPSFERCVFCNASYPASEENEHTKAHVLELLGAGNGPKLVSEKLKISVNRVAAYQRRAAASVPAPATEQVPPIRAKNAVVEKEQEGREASQRLKDYKQQVRQQPAKPSETKAACGKCVYRTIDGVPRFFAQPNCAEHGLGFGIAKEGMERKGEPVITE